MRPTHYTLYEGGDWYPWKNGDVSEADLEQRAHRTVEINGKNIHSLLFGPLGSHRWDCINGWTS